MLLLLQYFGTPVFYVAVSAFIYIKKAFPPLLFLLFSGRYVSAVNLARNNGSPRKNRQPVQIWENGR